MCQLSSVSEISPPCPLTAPKYDVKGTCRAVKLSSHPDALKNLSCQQPSIKTGILQFGRDVTKSRSIGRLRAKLSHPGFVLARIQFRIFITPCVYFAVS